MRNLQHLELKVSFHDFSRLCRDDSYAKSVLSSTDCVLCNVGPYAHYYHFLREKFGLEFSITRDVKTALWSSYLLQEALCHPYLRDGDALIVPSHYSKALARRLFPHLCNHPIFIFEPVMNGCQSSGSIAMKSTRPNSPTTLGYIGRLSEDKNFPQLIDLLVFLNREGCGEYRLLACGDVHSPSCNPELLKLKVRAQTGKSDIFEYFPALNHKDVWKIYRQFDVFLFPSTSNLETLGRVVLEASLCGLPVLASNHAATPEMLHEEALSPVEYIFDTSFNTHFDVPLGKTDVIDMARKLERGDLAPARCHHGYNHVHSSLVDFMVGNLKKDSSDDGEFKITDSQRSFIDLIAIEGVTNYDNIQDADAIISRQMTWFSALQNKVHTDYRARISQLMDLSKYKERTRRFVATNDITRGDFTNIGGVDMELCHIAEFWPSFQLRRPLQTESSIGFYAGSQVLNSTNCPTLTT